MSANWEVFCLRAQAKFEDAQATLEATPIDLNADLYCTCGALVELSRQPKVADSDRLIESALASIHQGPIPHKVNRATVNAGIALHFIAQVLEDKGVSLSGAEFTKEIAKVLTDHPLKDTIIKYLRAACDPDSTVQGAWGSILARRILHAM